MRAHTLALYMSFIYWIITDSEPLNIFQIREEPPSYTSSVMQRYESFENPLAGRGSQSFESQDEDRLSSGNPQSGKALYDFTAGGDDEVRIMSASLKL